MVETPDKLFERICGLADHCDFPTDAGKRMTHTNLTGSCPQQHRPGKEAACNED